MSEWYSLEKKTVWVTGGAGHLGTPITEALDRLCGKTVCIDLDGRAEALVRDQGLKRTVPVSLDVSNPDRLAEFVERAVSEHGVPDGLIHLAFATSRGKKLGEITALDFKSTLDLSLTSTLVLCRELGERMKARGSGSVVLFGSMYGLVSPDPRIYKEPAVPNPIDYGTAKAGILQMTRYLAAHYGPCGVRFNSVSPGAFPDVARQKPDPEFIRALSGKAPLGRIGMNHEMVGPCLFLLSEGASFVTGHNLVVDGGWTVW